MRTRSVCGVALSVALLAIGAVWLMTGAGAAAQAQPPSRGGATPIRPNPSTEEPAHKTTYEQVINALAIF